MNFNYQIVLFKNKKKKKIINKFKTNKKAKVFFENLIKKSNEVIFPTSYENGQKVFFEIAIIEKTTGSLLPLFLKDEIGRQIKATLDDDNFTITKIETYNLEEEFIEYETKNKITTPELIIKYLNSDGLKLISKLNNKIVIQQEEKVKLFTLKNVDDADRFIDVLSQYFIKNKKMDCLLVKDHSTSQRKYLYEFLSDKGYPKNYLQRLSTTHPSKR
jgi:hypothetical protein